jgi:hypothetical protein
VATDVLRLVYDFSVSSTPTRRIFDECALAVQVPCCAMLSFGQKHIGELNPFFLEHSLSHVILHGASQTPNDKAEDFLHLQLLELTCAGDMIKSKVMTFAGPLRRSWRDIRPLHYARKSSGPMGSWHICFLSSCIKKWWAVWRDRDPGWRRVQTFDRFLEDALESWSGSRR